MNPEDKLSSLDIFVKEINLIENPKLMRILDPYWLEYYNEFNKKTNILVDIISLDQNVFYLKKINSLSYADLINSQNINLLDCIELKNFLKKSIMLFYNSSKILKNKFLMHKDLCLTNFLKNTNGSYFIVDPDSVYIEDQFDYRYFFPVLEKILTIDVSTVEKSIESFREYDYYLETVVEKNMYENSISDIKKEFEKLLEKQ